ncbi:N-acetylneuraminate synthase family protein [Tropicimonas aquimaris]|uniref:N-acetylneuraminate synthase family protein n=1 Tax=Tropicimonas aquimaris TaxID=914152 RepID=A0ABW3IY86_9RHOB
MTKTNLFAEAFAANRIVVIAEIGVNHNGSMELARQSIDAAVGTGVDAVKFQIYRTDELVTAKAEKAEYQKATTGALEINQRDMLEALELSQDQHRELSDYCTKSGIAYVCTPYDTESARFLAEDLQVTAIKVASSDTTNIPFLKAIDGMARPVILSTGMCNMDEVRDAVDAMPETRKRGELYLLQCTSEYPAPAEESNLRVMRTLADEFCCPVGFSDHTVGNEVSVLAAAHGAQLVEKHFTLDRTLPGPDHRASSEPADFTDLVQRIRRVEIILGSSEKRITEAERANKSAMQKSIYWRNDMAVGTTVTLEDLAFKRPAVGLRPNDVAQVIGRALVRRVESDQAVSLEDLS